jgi:integrase
MPCEKPPETPALTWTEYLRLLETARTLEDKRSYLFVKLFCNTEIRIRELPNVTVETVNAGEMTTGSKKSPTRLLFPSALRAELLDYASGAGIRGGSLFVRRNGNPLNHSEILLMIVKLFKKAGVPRNKATSKALRQFYRTTRERIHSEIAAQVEGNL